MDVTISAAKEVIIGNNVSIGETRSFADHNHEYRDIHIEIIIKGLVKSTVHLEQKIPGWVKRRRFAGVRSAETALSGQILSVNRTSLIIPWRVGIPAKSLSIR